MSTNKYKFQNLTPIDNADISIYEDALKYVFSNNEIKNVAISGSYSAGKSSIIETYKKSHADTKFIHISLAHFDSFDEGNIEFDEQKGNSLEGKILNQLIHQIEPDKIPQTKFNIKKELSEKDTYKTIAYFVVLLVSILFIFNFSNWKEYVLNSDVDISIKLRLLNYTSKPISIARESYQEEIVLHILKNNFQSSDLKYIIHEYGAFSDDIKIVIVAITEENIDKVIAEEISLPYSLLIEILKRTTIDEMVRFEVLSYSLPSLDFNQCKRCLTILQADEYLSLFEGKRPKIFANATSDRILEVFKKNSWISKYEFDEDHENYRVIGKKTYDGFRYI